MPYSYDVVAASGATAVFSVPFDYLKKEHVHVTVNGALVPDDDLTWLSENQIELPSVPTAGALVRRYRQTPAGEMMVTFQQGRIDAKHQNLAVTQLLYIIQEAFDLQFDAQAMLDQLAEYLNTVAVALAAAHEAAEEAVSAVEDITAIAATIPLSFPTKAMAEAATIPGIVNRVVLLGRTIPGLGGGTFIQSVSEPTHGGKFQSDDGQWWVLDEPLECNPIQFGANLGANDTTALRDAFNYGAKTVDGLGFTYNAVASTINGVLACFEIKDGQTVKGLKVNYSTSPQWSYCFFAQGTKGTARNATSSIAKGAFSINSASASTYFSPGQKVMVRTNEKWGAESGATEERGEIKTVASSSSTTVVFTEGSHDTYTLGSSTLRLVPVTMKKNIRLIDCEFIGGGENADHYLALLELVDGLHIERCRTKGTSLWGFDIRSCINGRAVGNFLEEADSDQSLGLQYGMVFSGACFGWDISGNTFRFFRHGVTLGGNEGVNRSFSIVGNTFYECIDAGIDTHPAADDVYIAGNRIYVNGGGVATRDGIMLQGANQICVDNTVEGFTGAGIALQLMASAYVDQNDVSGNRIHSNQSNVIGLFVENYKATGNVDQITLGRNNVKTVASGSRACLIQSVTGSGNMRQISLSGGNYESGSQSAITVSVSTGSITDVAIVGLTARNNETTTFYGIRGLGSGLSAMAVHACVIRGGWAGLRVSNATYTGSATTNTIAGFGAGGAVGTP